MDLVNSKEHLTNSGMDKFQTLVKNMNSTRTNFDSEN